MMPRCRPRHEAGQAAAQKPSPIAISINHYILSLILTAPAWCLRIIGHPAQSVFAILDIEYNTEYIYCSVLTVVRGREGRNMFSFEVGREPRF